MDVFDLAYGNLARETSTYGDVSRQPKEYNGQRTLPTKKSCPFLPKPRDEDAKVLYQISCLLNKKGPKNSKTNNCNLDEDKNGSDSESSGFVSLDNGNKASIESSEIITAGMTEEEREALILEGYPILNRGPPCTKSEERALKRIRRKIKNKLSAQESRRKKKEYVESLEKKLDSFNCENSTLREQVESLNNTVRSLLNELERIQGTTTKQSRGTQSGACLKCYLEKKTGRKSY